MHEVSTKLKSPIVSCTESFWNVVFAVTVTARGYWKFVGQAPVPVAAVTPEVLAWTIAGLLSVKLPYWHAAVIELVSRPQS